MPVQLKWRHGVQFAGIYAGIEQGYYAAEGLEVSALPGGPETSPIASVLGGRGQFGLTDPNDIIRARAEGKPVRAIAAIFRRNPFVFATLPESGIKSPRDFAGKTVRVTPADALILRRVLAQVGIPVSSVTEVNVPNDLEKLRSGEIPVWGIYSTGFAITAKRAGIALRLIHPDDYGVHTYADTLFTLDATIERSPNTVLGFLRGTLRGWDYVIANPGLVPALVAKYDPGSDAEANAARIRATLPLVKSGPRPVGWMDGRQWERMVKDLQQDRIIANSPGAEEMHTMRFLEEIHRKLK